MPWASLASCNADGKEVRVKDLNSHAVKALLVSRALLVKIKRDLENQIRGLLKNLGLVIGRAKMNVFAARATELIQDRPELTAAVVPLLKTLGRTQARRHSAPHVGRRHRVQLVIKGGSCPRRIIEKLPPASGTEVPAGTWRW
jgi:transposase